MVTATQTHVSILRKQNNNSRVLCNFVLCITAAVTGNGLICFRWSHLSTKITFEENFAVMTYINKTRKREYFPFHRRTDFQLSKSQVYSQMFGLGTSYLCYQYISISIKQRKADGSVRRGSLRNRGVQKVIANCAGPGVVTAVFRRISVFWNMKLCRRLKVDRRFGKHVASVFMVGD